MKVLIIPDVHGSRYWKSNFLKNIEKVDRCVFLGDYINSFNIYERGEFGLSNFEDILETTKSYDNVFLLIGNHDLAHCKFNGGESKGTSGYEKDFVNAYSEVFQKNKKRFLIGIHCNDWVISHAGFSKVWFEIAKKNYQNYDDPVALANDLWHTDNCELLKFNINGVSRTGDDICQGPLWIRPNSLIKDAYYSNQVVGHSELKDAPLLMYENDKKIILCDSPKHNKYHILNC